jgi:hypothetical protein
MRTSSTSILLFALVFGVVSTLGSLHAQTPPIQGLSALDSLHSTRLSINKTAMLTLGAWAVGNIALNGALMLNSSKQADPTPFYFQQMNVFWNVFNAGLAASGYFGAMSEPANALSLANALEQQASIERILLFNTGLDVAYIAAGAWMLERSKIDTERTALWQGYGQSLFVQGGFLLLFDVSVFAIHHLTTEPMIRNILQSVRLTSNGAGLGLGVSVVLR